MWKLTLELAPLVILASGIGLCSYIFYSLKREIAGLANELDSRKRESSDLEARLYADIQELRQCLKETEDKAAMFVPPPPLKSGFNLNKRSQVLRMSRHGETSENIAAALSLP